jgi:hypothetical protein
LATPPLKLRKGNDTFSIRRFQEKYPEIPGLKADPLYPDIFER